MKSFKPLPVAAYIISDMVAASAAWWLFTWYRRNKLQEGHTGFLQMFTDTFFQTSISTYSADLGLFFFTHWFL